MRMPSAAARSNCSQAIATAAPRRFMLAHSFIIERLQKRTTQFVVLLFGLPLLMFLVLALAQWGAEAHAVGHFLSGLGASWQPTKISRAVS
jgi:hypothetical protein